MLNCKKLAKMLEKKYSEGAWGHYITSPKFRVLRMEADSMAKKLRYYYERMRVLHDKFAYINRVKRGYPLKILGENLLTIKDVMFIEIHLKIIVCVDFMSVMNFLK